MILTLFEALAVEAYAFCIVGAGPVGLALGLSLARMGARVLMLELGGATADPASAALARTEIVEPDRHAAAADAVRRGLGGTSRRLGGGLHALRSGGLRGAAVPAAVRARLTVPRNWRPTRRGACAFFGCGGPGIRPRRRPAGGGGCGAAR